MSRDRIFYLACFGFGAGTVWRALAGFDFYTAFFIGFVYLVLILVFSVLLKKNWNLLISVFLLTFLLGVLRFQLADAPAPEIFETRVGQNISLAGTITDQPAQDQNNWKFTVEAEAGAAKTGIAFFTKNNGEYRYGDRIQITGKLEKPKNFITDQGKEFDYRNYLRKGGVFYVMRDPQIKILAQGGGNFLKRTLFSLKEKLDAAAQAAIPAPESVLLGALILGERSSLGQNFQQDFIRTGTIHIITVSGYHVSLVASWIMKLFAFLPRAAATGAGLFAVFLYIIITGGAPPAIRSGIMVAIALLARTAERQYDAGRALILAAALMAFLNPFTLVYDVSFQLSFLATVAIIFFSPQVEKYFFWIPWRWLRQIVGLTAAMYLFVLPFILYKIGNLSLVALPANIAILPVIPATMIFGFLTAFAGLLSGALAFLPGKIAYALLHYQLAAVGFFSRLPFASVIIPDFPLVIVLLIYTILFYILFGKFKNKPLAPVFRLIIFSLPLLLTFSVAGFLYQRHQESNQLAESHLQALVENTAGKLAVPFAADPRIKSAGCVASGSNPDHGCTPGAIFPNAAVEKICVPGYTKTARNVSTSLRKKVYAEYNIAYPQPKGAYEADHLIPLALGGSNDIANLWTEAAEPRPGFHEKDVVEIFLQEEVCAGRADLSLAQRQTATDWLAVYNAMTPEQILAIKKKFRIP